MFSHNGPYSGVSYCSNLTAMSFTLTVLLHGIGCILRQQWAVYPTLHYKEIWVSPKIKVLPSGTYCSKLWTLKYSAMAGQVLSTGDQWQSIVYHTDLLCRARWAGWAASNVACVLVGLLAAAETCTSS